MARIGVLGGTFHPPQYGAVIRPGSARHAVGLEKVLFVPAGDPPHKRDTTRESAEHRVSMLARALPDDPRFVISRADLDRPGPHYTIDMLAILQEEHPEAALYFVMGGDSLRDLPSWHHPEVLIERCTLAVMQRPNIEVHAHMHDDSLPGLPDRAVFIDGPRIGTPASDVARWIARGQSVRYLLPPLVLDYIEEHGLYR